MALHVKTFDILKELYFLVRDINKIYKKLRYCISGVCKQFIKKLEDYFFVIVDLGTASFVNGYMSPQIKENSALMKHFGPMYIDFDGYPPYSDTISEILEQMLMLIFSVNMGMLILQANRKCAHRLMSKFGKC